MASSSFHLAGSPSSSSIPAAAQSLLASQHTTTSSQSSSRLLRLVDALSACDDDDDDDEDLGAVCHVACIHIPGLVQMDTLPASSISTCRLYILNTAAQELWTMEPAASAPHVGSRDRDGSEDSNKVNKYVQVKISLVGASDICTVAVTGETITRANHKDGATLGVQYCLPVKAPRTREVVGILKVTWGAFELDGGGPVDGVTNFRKSRSSGSRSSSLPNAISGSSFHQAPRLPPLVARSLASQRRVLLTSCDHLGRTIQRTRKKYLMRTSLATTSEQLAQVRNGLHGAEAAHESLRAHLRLERSLVRCVSALATWPRKEAHETEDSVEWDELVRIFFNFFQFFVVVLKNIILVFLRFHLFSDVGNYALLSCCLYFLQLFHTDVLIFSFILLFFSFFQFRISEDLVTELAGGSSGGDLSGSSDSGGGGGDGVKLYVRNETTDQYWRTDTSLPLHVSERIDASAVRLTTSVNAGRASFGPTLLQLSEQHHHRGSGGSATPLEGGSEHDVVLIPVIDGDRNVVGVLELLQSLLPAKSMDKSISVLSDYGAHIALAMGRMKRRARARAVHRDSSSRLESARRRSTLLLSVEQMWGLCTNTKTVFDTFELEVRRMLCYRYGITSEFQQERRRRRKRGRRSGGVQVAEEKVEQGTLQLLRMSLFMPERGGRGRLWSLERGAGAGAGAGSESTGGMKERRWVVPVGSGTLVGSAASQGVSLMSSDEKTCALVVRKMSGEIAAIIAFDVGGVRQMGEGGVTGEGEEDVVVGHDIGSTTMVTSNSRDGDEVGGGGGGGGGGVGNSVRSLMTSEDLSLLNIWSRHVASAVEHFETVGGCVEGMGNASEALSMLEVKNAQLRENVDRHTHSALRFCRDTFFSYGRFTSCIRPGSYDWMYGCQRRMMRMVDCHAVMILTYDKKRDMLVGAVTTTSAAAGGDGGSGRRRRREEGAKLYELSMSKISFFFAFPFFSHDL